MELGVKHREKLPELKKNVEAWHEYFKRNNQRFWDYTRFVCATSISSTQRTALNALNKPALEFNILEAMVSRLLGEFIKHAPEFEVQAADGVPMNLINEDFTKTLDVIEGLFRSMFGDSSNDGLKYKFYSDLLRGGFSAGEVITRYVNPRSFEQVIEVERVFDPTLCFWDPMARLSHKGDGKFCGKLVPMTIDDFKDHYGAKAADEMKFGTSANLEGFNWSYQNQQQDIVLVASSFVKEVKRIKIVKLTNGHVVPLKHYEKLAEAWEEEKVMAVCPRILDERWTEMETLCRYEYCDTKTLDYKRTNFTMHPIVFIDGNSVLIRGQDIDTSVDSGSNGNGSGSETGQTVQLTKPYVQHAKDMQLLMNFAGQSLASEMENIVQHQYIAAAESIPEDYQQAYENPQLASVLVYNQLYDKDPSIQLNPPQVLERRMIPPIIESTFNGAVQHIQTILGTYEASLGINDKQLSGVAIQQGALQSNAAALPYLHGYTQGLERFAEIILDLIPKYYRTPRTLPIIKSDGKRDYQLINKPNAENSVSMDYDPNNLQVKVEMGVSAEVQKQQALETIENLSAAIPDFGNFINLFGMPVILDNLNIRGIDHLKELSEKYTAYKQQQAEASQGQPSPEEAIAQAEIEVGMAQVEQQREKAQGEQANKAAQLAIQKQEADMKFIEILAKIESDETKSVIERERIDAENAKGAVELAVDLIDKLVKE